jgi:hypothetical protein
MVKLLAASCSTFSLSDRSSPPFPASLSPDAPQPFNGPQMSQSNRLWMGVPLIVGALLLAATTVRAFWAWNVARSWVSTPATILNAELKSVWSLRGNSHGTKLAVEYEYQWDGVTYRNAGVSPFNDIEPSSAWKGAFLKRLHSAAAKRSDTACFVDADNPSFAYLDRDFRVGAFLVNALISVFLGWIGVFLIRRRGANYGSPESSSERPANENVSLQSDG